MIALEDVDDDPKSYTLLGLINYFVLAKLGLAMGHECEPTGGDEVTTRAVVIRLWSGRHLGNWFIKRYRREDWK